MTRSAWELDGIVERLHVLFGAGHSCGQMAKILNHEFGERLSRNSIISKVRRTGWQRTLLGAPSRIQMGIALQDGRPPKPRPAKPATPPKPQRDNIVKEARMRGEAVAGFSRSGEVPTDIAAAPREWTTRLLGECAWPVDGEGADTRSCCNPSAGQTYCPDHQAIAYRPVQKWERNGDRIARRAA